MTGAAPQVPALDPRTGRRKAFGRFLVAHMLAYVPALVWSVAWVPIAIIDNFATLEKTAQTEKMVSDFVLGQLIAPIVVVALVPHLFAIPWIRNAERRWLVVFGVATALLTIAGGIVAIVYWAKLLAGR
jgi:hypothetical protein